MSNFLVIQISEEKIEKDEHIDSYSIYNCGLTESADPLIAERSDYGGDERKFKDVAKRIQHDLRPIATVNIRKKTITFKPKEVLMKRYMSYLNKVVKEHKAIAKEKGLIKHYNLKTAIEDVFGIDLVFRGTTSYTYCMTSGYLLAEYMNGYIPRVLHIGAILSCHC